MDKKATNKQCFLFLSITFLFTWLCWLGLLTSGLDPADPESSRHPAMLLWPLGQFGPFIAVLVLAAAGLRTGGVKNRLLSCRWRPTFRFPAWYLTLLLPVLWICPAWFYASWSLTAEGAGEAPNLASALLALLSATVFAFGEEAGWRGFLLPQLLGYRNRLVSSVMIGMVWFVWHLPILYLTSYETPLRFAVFLAGYAPTLVLWSILLTWVFERTGRNIWIPVLLHGAFTATYNLAAPYLAGEGTAPSLLSLVSALLLAGTVVLCDKPFWTNPVPAERQRFTDGAERATI
jgi:membrane protease YdiL (CAAX protease family)